MAQMPQPIHPRDYDEGTHNTGLHSVIEGEDVQQQHQEKQSVMKKVKAKAKKIKDKLTSHGHGNEHDEEEDDDESEDIAQDPEIHGAPIYESATVRSAVSRPGVNLGQPGDNLEKPSVTTGGNLERPSVTAYGSQSRPGVNVELPVGGTYLERSSVKEENRHDDSYIYDPPVRPFGQWQEENSGLGKPTETHAPVDLFNPGGHGHDVNVEKSRGGIGEVLSGMEEDPHAPKSRLRATAPSSYETKVTDPTSQGGKEAGITSLLHSLDKMGIHDDSNPKSKPEEGTKVYTGSHDQFSPETVPKSVNPEPEELPRDTLTGNPSNPSSYTEKISSATSAIAGKAVAAKDVIASKLGYTGTASEATGSDISAAKSTSPTEYAQKVAATVTEKLAPVYGKVAGAGSAMISKVPGVGTGQAQQGTAGTGQEGQTTVGKGTNKGVSVTSYLTEKLRPGDEDKALSEVITHAFNRGEEKGKVTEPTASGGGDRPISEAISDALHKREPEKEFGEGRPMGKVTESEEVARRLGTGKEEHTDGGEGNVNAEKGVVDRLKGAVSSWIGKGGETQSSTGTTVVSDEGLSSPASAEDDNARNEGERKLQASSY